MLFFIVDGGLTIFMVFRVCVGTMYTLILWLPDSLLFSIWVVGRGLVGRYEHELPALHRDYYSYSSYKGQWGTVGREDGW